MSVYLNNSCISSSYSITELLFSIKRQKQLHRCFNLKVIKKKYRTARKNSIKKVPYQNTKAKAPGKEKKKLSYYSLGSGISLSSKLWIHLGLIAN